MRIWIAFILSALTASAANLCVSVSSSGGATGADWNNALGASFTPVRGNTYYVSDGAYGSKTWSTAVSSTALITIKKATVADHVTATGWSDTMGDGQAVWTGWSVTTAYWTFDGQAGGGPGSWVSGYGFKISNPSYSDGAHLLDSGGNNITDLTVQHTEMTFSNATDTASYGTGIYFASGITRLTLISNAVYQIPGDMAQLRSANAVIVDHCFFSENLSVSAKHGDVFEHDGTGADHTYRFNYFYNCVGTYCMSDQSGAGALSDVKIYGNIWEWTSAAPARGFDNGLVATDSAGTGISGLRFFNNTIYGFSEHSGCHSGFYINAGASDNVVSNNIWYGFNDAGNNMDVGWTGITTHDYNTFRYAGTQSEANSQALSADPFTSAAGHDFSLSANTTAGAALGSPYTTDIVGSTRTTWSRGAFEYGSGGGGDVTSPEISITSPTSSDTYSTSSSTIDLSGTASDDTSVASVSWSNSRGGSGSATGTTSWSKTGITLQSGGNVITVTATDAASNSGTDQITVTYTAPTSGGTTNNVGTLIIR